MVAGGQDGGNLRAFKALRPCVMGIFEQSPLETFLGPGVIGAHDAWKQPDAGLDQRHGGDLAARKHEIAERNLLHAPRLDDALVQTLEAAAEEDGARPFREFAHAFLGQGRSARGKIKEWAWGLLAFL